MSKENNNVESEQVAAAETKEPSIDEINRDNEVLAMAKELGIDDGDFDPQAAGVEDEKPLSEDEQQKQIVALAQTEEGSLFFASEALNTYETLMQQFGHPKFAIDETQKEQTAKTIAPVVRKYGGSALNAFSDYKAEVLAAIAVGSLTFGSIKQIKQLKAFDKAKEVKSEEEKPSSEPKQPETAPESTQAA